MNPASRLSLAVLVSLSLTPHAFAAIELGNLGPSTIRFEGLVQGDANAYNADRRDLGDDRLRMRRAEFVLKAEGPGPLDFSLGWDAKAEKFLDTNVRARWEAAGLKHSLRVGQFKQPNSLDDLTSSRNDDFITKATATNLYSIGRRLGVGYELADKHWSVSGSVFGDDLTGGLAEGDGYALRALWLPPQASGNTLQLGLNHASYALPGDRLRLRARPNADLTDVRLIDTGTVQATDRLATTGLEAMWLAGPLKLQGEYFHSSGQRQGYSDFNSHGGYASAVYNLGGHGWSHAGGVPVPPKAGDIPGGLWQLAARYDRVDLDDGAIAGGRQQALTLGLNYSFNAYTKFQLNWATVRSERRDPGSGSVLPDDPSSAQARIQLHW